jgi:hypothetical protein
MERETVTTERIRHDAALVIIRLGLGLYRDQGPAGNVMEPESLVAWSTVVNELAGEGYFMVSPEEYAELERISPAEVERRIWEDGSLFALVYRRDGEVRVVVPLDEKREGLGRISIG